MMESPIEPCESEIDPGPVDPGPCLLGEQNDTAMSVRELDTNRIVNGHWESDAPKNLENPAYVNSLDSSYAHSITDALQKTTKGGNCDKYEPASYTESFNDEEAETALITYTNEQDVDEFRASSEDKFSDSSYVDSVTSNSSTAALLSEKRNHPGPLLFSSQTITVKPNVFSDYDISGRSLSSRDLADTKVGLYESSAYIDHLSCISPSQRQLESACRNALITLSQDNIPARFLKMPSNLKLDENLGDSTEAKEKDEGDFNSINRHMRNLIFLGISISLMNTAIGSLRNLQSSLNHDDGVGLYSLAASMTGFMIFSLFTPFIIQRFRPKNCLVLSLIPQLLYVFSNLYPTFHVFIPSSFLQGVANAVLWNAVSTYITYLARSYALQNDVRTVPIASKYFGIFFFFFQFSIVAGNIVSSVVLMSGKRITIPDKDAIVANVSSKVQYLLSNASSTLYTPSETKDKHLQYCGAKYCHSNNIEIPGLYVDDETKYMLLGIFGVCVIFSIVIAFYLLDMLKPYRTTRTSCSVICKQLTSVLRCAVDPRFLRLFLMFAYTCMQMTFVAGDVTKAFVTCTTGIHMVGYTMVCYGVCGGFASYISGCLNKHLGHLILLTTAAILNLFLIVVMSLWQPSSGQLIMVFALVGCWGLGDGIWLSQASSLISQIFPDKIEEAFAAQRFVQGLGGAVSFCYASSLCTTVKMMILAAVCLLGLILYIIQEIIGRRKPLDVQDVES